MSKQNRTVKSGSRQIAEFDKIIKENLYALLPKILPVLDIEIEQRKDVQVDIQHTKERKPDLLQKVTDTQGNSFILHVEFQVAEEKTDMVYRMADYYIMLKRKFGLPVKQYVIFLGEDKPQTVTEINDEVMQYKFSIVWFKGIDINYFLQSENPDDINFAVLCDFKEEQPEVIAETIIKRLSEKRNSELGWEKSIQQLRVLSNLRKLQPLINNIMENISKYFKEENDYFFVKGREEGREEGIEKGIEAERLRKDRQFVIALLRSKKHSLQEIAVITDVTLEFVEKINHELNL
jgi:predicted transposase YdaD